MLIRKEGSKHKGMSLLIVIKEGAKSGSFIFWSNFRIVLRSVYSLKYWFQWECLWSESSVCVICLSEPGALAGVVFSVLVEVAEVFLILYLLLLWCLKLLLTFWNFIYRAELFQMVSFSNWFHACGLEGNQFSHFKSGIAFASMCWL